MMKNSLILGALTDTCNLYEIMKTVDTTGMRCPRPLILAKEALQEINDGERVTIITDNETSMKNLISFLEDQGAKPEVHSSGRVHRIVTGKLEKSRTEAKPEKSRTEAKPEKSQTAANPETCPEAGEYRHDYVVCIKSDLMGSGDPELGKILIETFMDHLKLMENLPAHVVLYNSGVKLAMKESTVCSALSELEELGTRIMLCGTCIDHFGIQYDIGVGMISNMVTITETLASAGRIIYP